MNAVLARVDRWQQRFAPLAVPVAIVKRFGEHGGGRLATTISYWSLFSIFPLMLAFVTVLNLVLANRPDTRQELVDGALGRVPVIGSTLADEQQELTGSVATVVVGLLVAIWSGLAAAKALQVALDEIWDVPMYQRPNGAIQRAKSLGFLVLLATGISVSTLASNAASIIHSATLVTVAGLLVTFVVNGLVLWSSFWFLTSGPRGGRSLLPGTVLAAAALVLLQLLGNWIVSRYISGASDTYGTFAVVIGLLSWFLLVSRVVLYGAELNAVLTNEVMPRSLVPDGGPTAGDRRAAELDVQRVQRDERLPVDTQELVDQGTTRNVAPS
jgi:inner membrane protein YhjD